MYNYRYYFDVTAGTGALEALCPKLAELGCKHPIIICDKGIMEIGLTDKVTDLLKKNGVEFDIYSGVIPEPTHSRVKEAADAEALGSAVRDRFVQLLKEWGVCNLSGLGLTKESVDGLLEEILADMFLYAGKREISAEDVLGILDLAYNF